MVGSLNPETITMLDPACGSGHILVEAYEVLKGIYLERGYRLRDIPRLILEKNLYGLDIDDRAAQLAGFALLMKARADDRRLLDNPPMLNVLALQESMGLDADAIVQALFPSTVRTRTSGFGDDDLFPGSRPQMSFDELMALKSNNSVRAEAVEAQSIRLLIDTFAHAKTFGSLIQIPQKLNVQLASMAESLQKAIQKGDLLAESAAQDLLPLVEQARVLGMQFDAVVANPPYMGGKYLTPILKDYLKANYKGFEKDLFSAFMIRDLTLAKESGQLGFMSPFVWMFISSYEELRRHFLDNATLTSLVQLEYSGFDGATVPICTFTLAKSHISNFTGCYIRLSDFRGADQQGPKTLEAIQNPSCSWFYNAKPDDFRKIPGSPTAYWVSEKIRGVFESKVSIGDTWEPKKGLLTSDDARFIRYWHEVSFQRLLTNAQSGADFCNDQLLWAPLNKGGAARRWYGNNNLVMKWAHNGKEMKEWERFIQENANAGGRVINEDFYFRDGVTWTEITSSDTTFRYMPHGMIFTAKGPAFFPDEKNKSFFMLGFLNSSLSRLVIKAINPTITLNPSDIARMPMPQMNIHATAKIVDQLVNLSQNDWDAYEQSWDYQRISMASDRESTCLKDSWQKAAEKQSLIIATTKHLEEENNRLFIEAYGLQDELSPEVPEEQITLTRADREKDCQRLISYAVGCMMGRYSLDAPGLIYAHSGNIDFDSTRYQTFTADADGIVPLTDEFWFEDDAANRIREFLLSVWGTETLEENMAWLAESVGVKGNETPEETIRRYLASSFFKNHLQTYKKRPIYWLFSSGKQGAFQALVYLHRYHEGTLARMRAEYVVPLTSKIQSRIEMLTKDAEVATVTSARNKINKEIETLRKQHVELLAYDEKLRHYADMRIQLDLDDGVKVNYGKFGDLLGGSEGGDGWEWR